MTVQQISSVDIQFSSADEKSRRMVDEIRKTQRALNALIQEANAAQLTKVASDVAPPPPAVGNWDITVIDDGGAPKLVVRYNRAGSILTGEVPLV
jgi:hypothetical protein